MSRWLINKCPLNQISITKIKLSSTPSHDWKYKDSSLNFLGWDSPSSTITVFSTCRIFHWISDCQRLRYESFKLGEFRPRFSCNIFSGCHSNREAWRLLDSSWILIYTKVTIIIQNILSKRRDDVYRTSKRTPKTLKLIYIIQGASRSGCGGPAV